MIRRAQVRSVDWPRSLSCALASSSRGPGRRPAARLLASTRPSPRSRSTRSKRARQAGRRRHRRWLNKAGKPVIHDLQGARRRRGPSRRARRRRRRVTFATGRHRAARPLPQPTAARGPCRSASRPVSPASRPGTLGARVTNGTNVYALSNNHVFAGVNTASIGDPIISAGRRGRRQRSRLTASARWPRTRRSTSTAARTRWTPRSR